MLFRSHVVINGENWGVYVNAEQFNRDFLQETFKTTAGARWRVPGSPFGQGGWDYRGPDVAAYRATYEIKTKDSPKAWQDLIHVFQVLNETPVARLESALAPLLDVDGVLRFLALENALANSDGYWARASDYSIYQDPQGRFHVIPHDMNEGLAEERAPGGRGGFLPDVTAELDPLIGLDDASKPLRSRLLAVPALRAKYLGYVRDIAERWLDWKVMGPMAKQYQAVDRKSTRLNSSH